MAINEENWLVSNFKFRALWKKSKSKSNPLAKIKITWNPILVGGYETQKKIVKSFSSLLRKSNGFKKVDILQNHFLRARFDDQTCFFFRFQIFSKTNTSQKLEIDKTLTYLRFLGAKFAPRQIFNWCCYHWIYNWILVILKMLAQILVTLPKLVDSITFFYVEASTAQTIFRDSRRFFQKKKFRKRFSSLLNWICFVIVLFSAERSTLPGTLCCFLTSRSICDIIVFISLKVLASGLIFYFFALI